MNKCACEQEMKQISRPGDEALERAIQLELYKNVWHVSDSLATF